MENLNSCINAMQRALMSSKDALQIELAVSLFVFSSLGSADIHAKKTLRGVYASAGRFDCLYPDSPSYKSVSRYMSCSAWLFESMTKSKIKRVTKDKPDNEAIEAIIALLAPLQLQSWDDVAKHATGKPRATQAKIPGTVHLKTAHYKLDLTPDVTVDELIELRQKLDEIIESKSQPKSNGRRKHKENQMHH